MSSIRGRLIARLVPAWLAILAVGALGLEYGLERLMLADLDEALADKARALATLVLDRGDLIEFEFADEIMPEYSRAKDPEYFEILREDGSLLEHSRSLSQGASLGGTTSNGKLRTWSLVLPDGRPGRAAVIRTRAHYEPIPERPGATRPDSPWITVRVARSREALERLATIMQIAFAVTTLVLAIVVTAVVVRAVRAGLEPLERLSAAVASTGENAVRLALDAPELPGELRSIRGRIDDLLARLSGALQRERRFTSAAAHELRTPIAELRAACEVALKWPEDGGQTRQTLEDAVAIAAQMEQIVASLLALSRAETGQHSVTLAQVGVREAVERALAPLSQHIEHKRLALSIEVTPPELSVVTDSILFYAIVHNLLDNAVTYTPDGGALRLKAELRGERFELDVLNRSVDLATDDLQRLTEPFWRKDPAGGDPAHAGLGLSLAGAFAHALGAELSFALEGDTLRARLSLPTADA